ncbi:MAG: hypothetical protein LUQ69_10060 [Methanoregulaceae archaeon]|nr:hypothetical protein [Methanoregulaceae archaeon]
MCELIGIAIPLLLGAAVTLFLLRRHPWARVLGTLLTGLMALLATAATIGLFMVGQKAHWTSDGPGMLFIMIGIGVSAMVALGLWFATLAQATAPAPGELP